MPPCPSRLSLPSNAPIPADSIWRIEEGYVRAGTLNSQGDPLTLALWGPGELALWHWSLPRPLAMHSLSRVVVEPCQPSAEEMLAHLRHLVVQMGELLLILRERSADERLLRLLLWIGTRFGRVSSRGTRLSLKEMNLTHQGLGELCGLTRVTVTKGLARVRALGCLEAVGDCDLWIPRHPRLHSVQP